MTLYCRLSEQAQNALESFGSSYSKQISFRDAWGFIGRPQIHGFSPFEEVLLMLILLIWILVRILIFTYKVLPVCHFLPFLFLTVVIYLQHIQAVV